MACEQVVFIGWLSNIIVGVCPMKISKGCQQYFHSVVHSIFGVLSTVFLECCPQYFRSMSNENIRGLSTIFWEYVQ